MSVLDSPNCLNTIINLIEGNEGNIQRVYSDHLGVPTIGIGYALAIKTGTDSNPNWVLRDVGKINKIFREAGILGDDDSLTQNDINILNNSVNALNGVSGAINSIPHWTPHENEDKSKTIHNDQGWSFNAPTLEENRKLLEKTLPRYQEIAIGRLKKNIIENHSDRGVELSEDQAKNLAENLWNKLSEKNQTTLLDLAYNGPGLIGPNFTGDLMELN